MTILVAIPTLGMVSLYWVNSFNQMEMPPNTRGEILWENGSQLNVAQKRNKIIEYAVENNFTHIFFLDDDVIIPKDTLRKLMHHDKDIVGGVYYCKQIPSEPLIFKNRGDGYYKEYPKNELIKAYGNGMGCCLMKTEIFKKIPREKWFSQVEFKSKLVSSTEEFEFWDYCRDNGIDIFIDTSIQCGHIDKETFNIYKEGGVIKPNG